MVRKMVIHLMWVCCAGLFLWLLAAPWFPKKVECPYCGSFKAACGSFSVRKDDPIVLVTTDCMPRSKFNPSEPARYEIVERSDRQLKLQLVNPAEQYGRRALRVSVLRVSPAYAEPDRWTILADTAEGLFAIVYTRTSE